VKSSINKLSRSKFKETGTKRIYTPGFWFRVQKTFSSLKFFVRSCM